MNKKLSSELFAALGELCDPLGKAVSKEQGEALITLGFARATIGANSYMATNAGRKHFKADQ
jgi:hypothetical protein